MIYADFECLLEKMHSCQNNPEKSYIEKKTKHKPSGYSLFTTCSFDAAKNTLDCYRGKDYIEKLCKDLREHAVKIVNYEKREMIPLNDEANKSYEKQKVCYIVKKKLILMMILMMITMMMTIKSIIKPDIIVITLKNLEELLIIFVI